MQAMQAEKMVLDVHMNLESKEQKQLIGLPTTPPPKPPPFFTANQMEQAGDLPGAQKIYLDMLNEDFDNCVVTAALGMNYAVQGQHGLANMLLNRSINTFDDRFEKDLKNVGVIVKGDDKGRSAFLKIKKSEMMNAVGTTWKHENKTVQARYWFERAQALLPGPNPDIQNNLATLHINEGSPAKALEHLDLALSLDPNHAQAHWNRSLANLEVGKYAEGFAEYGWGKRAEVRMSRNYAQKELPEWDGSAGKTVVVYGEQGIGDEIMFMSMLPEMIRDCKQVIVDCHKKLHRLLANSFPMLDIYPTREDENITWPLVQGEHGPVNRYPVDAKIAIGDVPQYYRKRIEDFPGMPYINPTGKAQVKWAKRLEAMFPDDKPVIALNWIGGHKKTRVEVRSLTLEQLLPILKLDAHFVSLQYTKCEAEIEEFTAKHGITIHHLAEAAYSDHYDEIGGVLANVDLVVTCCSSIVHLAGSMGVPCYVLTPSRPAWRYRLDLDHMPWYGQTVRLFRQKHGSVEWEPVVEDVAWQINRFIEVRNDKPQQRNEKPADAGTEGQDKSAGAVRDDTGGCSETVRCDA